MKKILELQKMEQLIASDQSGCCSTQSTGCSNSHISLGC